MQLLMLRFLLYIALIRVCPSTLSVVGSFNRVGERGVGISTVTLIHDVLIFEFIEE